MPQHRAQAWTFSPQTMLGSFSRLIKCIAPALIACTVHAQPLLEPLPVEESMPRYEHVLRPGLDLSADGRWVAHTYRDLEPEPLEKGAMQFRYSSTGVAPLGAGTHPHARLSDIETGNVIELADAKSSSWAPVWSPDGRRVAFYSDQDGEAGLWIWERNTRRARRFPGVIVRPTFGFEVVRWSSDSRRVLVKILPEGVSIADANALFNPQEQEKSKPQSQAASDQPTVIVRESPRADAKATASGSISIPQDLVDLAILDLESASVRRLVKRVLPSWYAFSPDGKYVGYALNKGREPDAAARIYDLVSVNLETGAQRVLVENLPFQYGMTINWSPDSRYLAYITSGGKTTGDCFVVSVAQRRIRKLGDAGSPKFSVEYGDERPPLWDSAGKSIFALSDGKLWRLAADRPVAARAYRIPGREITGIVSQPESGVVWSGGDDQTVWVTTRSEDKSKGGIWRINLKSGASSVAMEDHKSYEGGRFYNLDASNRQKRIAFVAEALEHVQEIWALDTVNHRVHRVTHFNERFDRYALGKARLVEWSSRSGQVLKGALLLPPDYEEGRRYPLVVWVYGGDAGDLRGSNAGTRFGLGWAVGGTFNFHVLATRGYALLYPDTPFREGTVMDDLQGTVLPAVDKVIELGIADPTRLAIMGQSFGSYSVLAIITQTQRFKAAIVSAVSLHPDLVSSYLADAKLTSYYERGQINLGGTPWEHRERYLANSPVYLFDRIETPLLMAHGSRDRSFAGLAAPDSVFTALQRLGKQVEYRLYQDEEHVVQRKANVVDFWNRRLQFLAEHLDVVLDQKGRVVFAGETAQSHRGKVY